jgi:hypothetical protein
MTPDPRAVIGDFAGRMMQVLAPDLRTPYLAGSAALMTATLGMLVEEYDRTAARLAEENTAIRVLCAQAAPLAPGALSVRLDELAKGDATDLHISALQAANNGLRSTLIDLQAWCETQTGPGVAAINEAIWAELAASTERRRFSTSPF